MSYYYCYYRNISNRAYLTEMALEMSGRMAKLILSQQLKKEPVLELDSRIQKIAAIVLSFPKYADKSHLMGRVLEHVNIYYRSEKFQKLVSFKERTVEETVAFIGKVIALSAVEAVKSLGFSTFSLRSQVSEYSDKPVQDFSCFEYALMRAQVREAFEDSWDPNNLLSLLSEWGFMSIEKEDSRPGDLVVFLKDGAPLHMGIRYQDKVLSKPGIAQQFAYVHTLEEAFSAYGDQVIFLRKL